MKSFIQLAAFTFMGIILMACATSSEVNSAENIDESSSVILEAKAESSETAKTAESETQIDGSEEVCKRTIVSGTRFKKKICMTRDQWEAQREVATRAAGEMQRRGTGNPNNNN